jgi:hypothetical protein
MCPSVEPLAYVACWEDEDGLSRVGGNYARGAVEGELWPWLKQRGFADTATPCFNVFWTSFSVIGPRICARAFVSDACGLLTRRPSSAPRSLKRSAASSMPCSPLRMSRRCRPQRPDLGALLSSTGNRPAGKPRPRSASIRGWWPSGCTPLARIGGARVSQAGAGPAAGGRGWSELLTAGRIPGRRATGRHAARWYPRRNRCKSHPQHPPRTA